MKTKKNKDDCTELKNIKYQNMLLSNSKISEEVKENINNIEIFLNKEKNLNNQKPWNKLGKSSKIKIIKKFIKMYAKKNKLSDDNSIKLLDFLKRCIDRKKLQKIKDIHYDIEKSEITSIPNLHFNKTIGKFIIKKSEKWVSTSKSLAIKSKKRKKINRKMTVKTHKKSEEKLKKKKDKLKKDKKDKKDKQKKKKQIKVTE
tara:strand:+ start:23 stop:625 length:603 start_codon:yes stop_codon:yes gene_type:complete